MPEVIEGNGAGVGSRGDAPGAGAVGHLGEPAHGREHLRQGPASFQVPIVNTMQDNIHHLENN